MQKIIIISLFVLLTQSCFAGFRYKAAKAGDIKRLKKLIAERVRSVQETNPLTPIYFIVKLYLNERSQETGLYCLHMAAMCRQLAMTKYLIDMGANVNQLNYHDETPLLACLSCIKNDSYVYDDEVKKIDKEVLQIVRVLVEGGADIDFPDTVHQTPLFCAARSCLKKTVKYLKEKGAKETVGIACMCESFFYVDPQIARILKLEPSEQEQEERLALVKKMKHPTIEVVSKEVCAVRAYKSFAVSLN